MKVVQKYSALKTVLQYHNNWFILYTTKPMQIQLKMQKKIAQSARDPSLNRVFQFYQCSYTGKLKFIFKIKFKIESI